MSYDMKTNYNLNFTDCAMIRIYENASEISEIWICIYEFS